MHCGRVFVGTCPHVCKLGGCGTRICVEREEPGRK